MSPEELCAVIHAGIAYDDEQVEQAVPLAAYACPSFAMVFVGSVELAAAAAASGHHLKACDVCTRVDNAIFLDPRQHAVHSINLSRECILTVNVTVYAVVGGHATLVAMEQRHVAPGASFVQHLSAIEALMSSSSSSKIIMSILVSTTTLDTMATTAISMQTFQVLDASSPGVPSTKLLLDASMHVQEELEVLRPTTMAPPSSESAATHRRIAYIFYPGSGDVCVDIEPDYAAVAEARYGLTSVVVFLKMSPDGSTAKRIACDSVHSAATGQVVVRRVLKECDVAECNARVMRSAILANDDSDAQSSSSSPSSPSSPRSPASPMPKRPAATTTTEASQIVACITLSRHKSVRILDTVAVANTGAAADKAASRPNEYMIRARLLNAAAGGLRSTITVSHRCAMIASAKRFRYDMFFVPAASFFAGAS